MSYFFIILFLILYFILSIGITMNLQDFEKKYNLKKNGVYAFPYTPNWKNKVLELLPSDYVFLNYKYIIRGCSLVTFHRDVTSGQFANKTKHPTYTVILYKYKGKHCSVCPNSHLNLFLFSFPITIESETYSVVIFNCDMIHAGALNKIGKHRLVEQYKIAHVDDIEKLSHLDNINLTKTGQCNSNIIFESVIRSLSYQFSFVINHIFTPLLQKKSDSGISSFIQNIIPVNNQFFNNDNSQMVKTFSH